MVEKPIPDNIQQTEMNTGTCGGCEDEVVIDDTHTEYCTWCDTPCHESCVPTHEENCEEKEG